MRRAVLLSLLAFACACGASDARPLASPVVAGERDSLPVRSTTSIPRASRGGERSSGTRWKTPTPPASVVAELDRQPTGARPGGSPTAKASWYGRGSGTASGERFDPNALTFAARSREWGRKIRFCHERRCVTARQTDYGPAEWTGRSFDLSRAAFASIADLDVGVIEVTWSVVA